ncbi:hypothetical protein ACFQ0M_11080 [Kitasatospora aburaviensis]
MTVCPTYWASRLPAVSSSRLSAAAEPEPPATCATANTKAAPNSACEAACQSAVIQRERASGR